MLTFFTFFQNLKKLNHFCVVVKRAELWHVHLISSRGSTLFSLRSIGRKRFSRAIAKDDKVEQIKVDATGKF